MASDLPHDRRRLTRLYKVNATENEMLPACRLDSLWPGWQQSPPQDAPCPVGMDLVGFLIIRLWFLNEFFMPKLIITKDSDGSWETQICLWGDRLFSIQAVRDYHPHLEGYKQTETLVTQLNDTVTLSSSSLSFIARGSHLSDTLFTVRIFLHFEALSCVFPAVL